MRAVLAPPSVNLNCVCLPQTSAVLCSGGCALLAVSSLLAIITIFLPSGGCERRICTLAGYMQMASGEHRREHAPLKQQHTRCVQNSSFRRISRSLCVSQVENILHFSGVFHH